MSMNAHTAKWAKTNANAKAITKKKKTKKKKIKSEYYVKTKIRKKSRKKA